MNRSRLGRRVECQLIKSMVLQYDRFHVSVNFVIVDERYRGKIENQKRIFTERIFGDSDPGLRHIQSMENQA